MSGYRPYRPRTCPRAMSGCGVPALGNGVPAALRVTAAAAVARTLAWRSGASNASVRYRSIIAHLVFVEPLPPAQHGLREGLDVQIKDIGPRAHRVRVRPPALRLP